MIKYKIYPGKKVLIHFINSPYEWDYHLYASFTINSDTGKICGKDLNYGINELPKIAYNNRIRLGIDSGVEEF